MENNNEKISAYDYSKKVLKGIEGKAIKNKNETTRLFLVVTIATVLSPILILLPLNIFFSKITPAILTGCAALATSWIQIRKPQERWAMYRTAQREIEFQLDQYDFSNGEYIDVQDKDSLLADNVSKRALQLHYEWLPVAPKFEELQKTRKSSLGRQG